MKTCVTCGKELTGRQEKNCSAACAMAAYYKRHPHTRLRSRQWAIDNPDKVAAYKATRRKQHNANRIIQRMVKSGKLVPLPCAVCGDIRSESHHPDYDKPREVIWLCHTHHMEQHRRVRPIVNTV